MEKICMNGVGGVERVTMHAKAGDELAEGMAVTLTGENEVGLGVAAGSPVFGVITNYEKTPRDFVSVGVQTSGFHDGVKLTATAAKHPDLGGAAGCNDKGEIVKLDPAPATSRAIVTAIDAVENVATIVL